MDNLRSEDEIIASWVGDINNPVVSICCTAYNHECYIEDALKGFLIQESNFPYEILIHDDASTDHTADIIRAYVIKYPRLIKPIYQKENQYSKNLRIMPTFLFPHARGEFIAMCEGDDYWIDKTKLEKQYTFLESNVDYSMCIHNAYKVDIYSGERSLFNNQKMPSTFTSTDVILKKWFSPTGSFFFRKPKENYNFPKDVNGDICILFENSIVGKIKYFDSPMSVYRYGVTGSMSATVPKRLLYKKKENFYRYCLKKSSIRLFFPVMFRIIVTKILLLIRG